MLGVKDTMSEPIPVLTTDLHGSIAADVGHDIRNDPDGMERVRWNNRAMAIMLKAVTDRDAKAAIFDEMRVALNWAEAALSKRKPCPARSIIRKALAKANAIK